MTLAQGFPPVCRADARVLVLGSLPGAASLARLEYYGHPRNAFWPLMGVLVGASPELPYAERCERLRDARVALWDVCALARRPGSLDAAIEVASVVPNDFRAFFAAHPALRCVFFNGAKAAGLYRRLVLPGLSPEAAALEQRVMPSTSPAHAGRSLEAKQLAWQALVDVT